MRRPSRRGRSSSSSPSPSSVGPPALRPVVRGRRVVASSSSTGRGRGVKLRRVRPAAGPVWSSSGASAGAVVGPSPTTGASGPASGTGPPMEAGVRTVAASASVAASRKMGRASSSVKRPPSPSGVVGPAGPGSGEPGAGVLEPLVCSAGPGWSVVGASSPTARRGLYVRRSSAMLGTCSSWLAMGTPRRHVVVGAEPGRRIHLRRRPPNFTLARACPALVAQGPGKR